MKKATDYDNKWTNISIGALVLLVIVGLFVTNRKDNKDAEISASAPAITAPAPAVPDYENFKHHGLIYAMTLTKMQFDDEKGVGFDDKILENANYPIYEWKCNITYRNTFNATRKAVAYVKIQYKGSGDMMTPSNWEVIKAWIYK